MRKTRSSYYILVAIVCVCAAMVGWNVLTPSEPNYIDRSQFNVIKAYGHIEEIAKEPHSIFDKEAHTEVREYLIEQFEVLGLNPRVYGYEDVYVERTETYEDIKNIYVEIPGQNDSYIMLVTHYDTSHAKTERYAEADGSHGAADAGYGLSTILETLRIILENDVELVNGIKVLITDAEEYGLLGAKAAVEEAEIFENVNYIVNLEARGVKGPALMFETNLNNTATVELYQHAKRPYSYSVNPEIYRYIPNPTDFTVFLEKGFNGVNISVLDGLEHYHTPEDNIDHISLESIQHYGDQVVPIVTEFVTNPKYSTPEALQSEDDAIFFTFTNQIFISYSHVTNWIFLGAMLVGIVILIRLHEVKLKKLLKHMLLNILVIGVFAGVSYGITRLVAVLIERPFKLTYLPLVPFEKWIVLGVAIGIFLLYSVFVYGVTKKYQEIHAYIMGTLTLMLLISVAITLVLPGGSYLTVAPTGVVLIGLLVSEFFVRNYDKQWVLMMLIPVAAIIILYVPTIYLFNAALTFGALSVNSVFMMIAYMTLISALLQMKHYMGK